MKGVVTSIKQGADMLFEMVSGCRDVACCKFDSAGGREERRLTSPFGGTNFVINEAVALAQG